MFLKKIIILLSIILIFFNDLNAKEINKFEKKFNKIQQYILITSYKVGKKYKTSDNITFGKTVASIALQESTAGKMLIGDKYEDKYYYIHYENGIKNKIFIEKEDLLKDKNGYYFNFNNNKNYRKKIYILKGQLKPLYDSSLGVFQIKPSTAEIMINKYFPEYKYLLNDKNKLIQKLLSDVEFSANIASSYLIYCYEEAKNRKMWNPYFKTISRYNGGWKNSNYYNNVLKKMKYLEKLNFFNDIEKKEE